MNKNLKFWLIAIFGLFIVSCSDDDDFSSPGGVEADYYNGFFVINEGNFGSGNSSISFISYDWKNSENSIFSKVNGKNLGNVAQSMNFYKDKAYIVVNASNKIEIVERYSFKSLGTISGLKNPRYIEFHNGKGYVSCWGNDNDASIVVFDANNFSVLDEIPVSFGPEKMEQEDGTLFVAHKGGFASNDIVSVINLSTKEIKEITVGNNPDSLEEEDGILYVLCSDYSNQGKLVKIDLLTQNIISSFDFNSGEHPSNLKIEDNNIYYTLGNAVYLMKKNYAELPSSPILEVPFGYINGFDIENGKIYVADAKQYDSEGTIFVYSQSGELLNGKDVGIIPNGFCFN